MNLGATAAPTETCSEQLSHTDGGRNVSPCRCKGVPQLPLQRVLSYCTLQNVYDCTRVQADCSQLTQFLEQQGNGQSSSGLPSHSLLARLLESQHKPPYPLLWSKLLSSVFSYLSKGLKEAVL